MFTGLGVGATMFNTTLNNISVDETRDMVKFLIKLTHFFIKFINYLWFDYSFSGKSGENQIVYSLEFLIQKLTVNQGFK
jgi:hypothetical protein